MNNDVLKNISKIIERDSKSTTYKFALLRGVIDIIQENSPYITVTNDRVKFPTGLLIEKWIIYYYPILESSVRINQKHGNGNLAFESQLAKIIEAYRDNNGLSGFYSDFKNKDKGLSKNLIDNFISLATKLKDTITKMPMRYIGNSLSENKDYSIFQFENAKRIKSSVIDTEYLINNFGCFFIPIEYYEAFKLLGGFINGQDSILLKWAEFSVNASKKDLSIEKVVNEVLKSPVTKRDVVASKNLYENILHKENEVICVWTDDRIKKFDVDHVIPFSAWKNNDLWNLLPSTPRINKNKLDKIPAPKFVESRKTSIIKYWELIFDHQPIRFQKEMQVALLGRNSFSGWKSTAINQLKIKCDFLISNRGYEEWKI